MENKFVKSCQENSKEVQEALIALGYKWFGGVVEVVEVQCLESAFVFTDERGELTYSNHNGDKVPCLYDFTEETKLVATLKPVNNRLTGLRELTELRKQADALMTKIKEMEAKQ